VISALVARYALTEPAAGQLEALVQLVATDPAVPTTVTDPAGILRDHVADSLVALELPVVRDASSIADLGSGAGFPGLPLAIALPTARVSLVEGNGRKCAFMAAAVAACGAHNATPVHVRAEAWPDGIGSFDLVTARALAPLSVVAEYAAPLLAPGGALVAWRGRRDPDDEAAGARAAAELRLEAREPIHVAPYPEALHRHLHVMVKVAPTPSRFPRRPGLARKRPLGAPSDRSPR
jgi:16S rRNA (guanine527-N7)-methyltransferase